MFPYEEDLEEIEETEDAEEEEEYYPKEYDINFNTGKLTGKIAEGARALAVWCYLALQTERYAFHQYSWDYGCEITELIGHNYSDEYVYSEIERMLTECLEVNPYINGIENLQVTREKDTIHIQFRILTDYGKEEVTANV